MRCYSSKEIADAEGLAEQTVREISLEFSDLKKAAKSDIANAEHATGFDPPIYNVWKQQEKSKGAIDGERVDYPRIFRPEKTPQIRLARERSTGRGELIVAEFSNPKKLDKLEGPRWRMLAWPFLLAAMRPAAGRNRV
jgi:hypothetical protein